MLSALPGRLPVPTEMSVTEGVQPDGAPWQVSSTKIFCVVPGVSELPVADACTNTPYRWFELISGKDNAPPAIPGLLEEPGEKTVNALLPEVPPPGAGAVTETWSVPVAVRLAAGITAAMPLSPMNMFVGRGAPFHCTTEHGEKPLPFTVSATGGPVSVSTAAFNGEMELMTGAGKVDPVGSAITENLRELEFVAGLAPDTVIATAAAPVARKAVSAGEISAVSCVAFTNVVGRGEPFQLTTSPASNPVPFTVKVRPVWLQYAVLFEEEVDAEIEVMVARAIVNEIELEVFVLEAGLATATMAVPTAAISIAGTVATNWAGFSVVGPMYAVANCVVVLPIVH